jgi:glycosyltransferase involved in cell wall biosynthesis
MTRGHTVSAVIPTRNRPDLVLRAVRSVLAQTYPHLIEAIVVVDGPDPDTSNALASIRDDRLRVILLPRAQGAQNARNTGIEAAHGEWIALLDDDDKWLPEKTALQMEVAMKSAFRYPIVSCEFFADTGSYQLVWPRRLPYKPLSEYLLARDSCSRGEGVLSTITLLFPKELHRILPLAITLQRCHDVDWLLRASTIDGVGIEFVAKPLAVAQVAEQRAAITTEPDWLASLQWVDSVRGLITARAYASYVAITVTSQAARRSDWSAFPLLFKRILMRGRPKFRDLAFFLGAWCVPRNIQLAVRKVGW